MILIEYTVSSGDTNTTPSFTGGSNFTYTRTTNSDGTIKVVCSCDTSPTRLYFNNKPNLLSVDYICTDSITSLYQGFYQCTKLHTVNMAGCNVEKLTTIQSICHGCTGLKNFICDDWNAIALTTMSTAFYGCSSLEFLDLSGIKNSVVTTMNEMCYQCTNLRSANLSGIGFTSSTSTNVIMNGAFRYATNLVHVNLRGMNFPSTCTFTNTFAGTAIDYIDVRECPAAAINKIIAALPTKSSSDYGLLFVEGNDESVSINSGDAQTKYYYVTKQGKPTVIYELTDTTQITPTFNTGYEFNRNPNANGSIICLYGNTLPTSISFDGKTTLKSIIHLEPSELTTAQNLFRGCSSLVSVNSKNWDFSKVTSMNQTFANCTSLTRIDARGWKVQNVEVMSNTFSGCTALTEIVGLGEWNTSKVYTLSNVFSGNKVLAKADGIEKWDVSKVTNFSFAFANTAFTKLNLSGWKTSSSTNMSFMFNAMGSIVELIFDTATVPTGCNITYMFQLCTNLTTLDISNLRIANASNNANLFNYANKLSHLGMVYCDADSINIAAERLLTGSATMKRTLYIPKSEKDKCPDSTYITFKPSSVDVKIPSSLLTEQEVIKKLYWDSAAKSYKIEKDTGDILDIGVNSKLYIPMYTPYMKVYANENNGTPSNIKIKIPTKGGE